MKFQVYRANASSYQDSKFLAKEKRVLEEIEGVTYLQSLQEAKKDSPFILITNTHTQLDNLVAPILNNTKLIVHPNSGYDNFDKDFIQNNETPIVIGNPIRANAVVEYTLSCIFNHFCQVPNHHHWSTSRIWNRKLLRDQKVVILGYGHIGQLLYKSLKSICRKVIVLDPFVDNPTNSDIRVNYDMEDFKSTDVILTAASLNPSSVGLINKNVFAQISNDALIINPARGEIINEQDLASFLRQNPNACAYLDVFEKEPFSPGHLDDVKNLNKTSHIAGVYEKLNSDIISFEYIVIRDFIQSFIENNQNRFESEYAECILTNKSKNYEPRIVK